MYTLLSFAHLSLHRDKSKTLTQNYQTLGLSVGLNKPTGGTEKTIKILEEKKAKRGRNKLAIESGLPTDIATTEARVERDPKTGQILRVIDEDQTGSNPLNDPLNDVESTADEDMQTGDAPSQTHLVQELEAQAAAGERKKPRHQSTGEKEWIEALVAKHGDDYDRMFRDRKLNPMQQSVGQIKKRVLEWRKNTGG